jgi:hypothetical protein
MSWIPGSDVLFSCGGNKANLTFEATDTDGIGSDSITICVNYEPC